MTIPTALVVEDSPNIRLIVSHVLSSKGWRIVEAASGPQGVEMAHRHRPALVVVDINLPGIDGFEVIRQIRADPALEEVPIIVMTAYVFASTAAMALQAGCQKVLFKPFDLNTLVYEVEQLASLRGISLVCAA